MDGDPGGGDGEVAESDYSIREMLSRSNSSWLEEEQERSYSTLMALANADGTDDVEDSQVPFSSEGFYEKDCVIVKDPSPSESSDPRMQQRQQLSNLLRPS